MPTETYVEIRKGIVEGLSKYGEVLSVEETAEILKVSKNAVYKLVRDKKLFKLSGRTMRIIKQSVINMMMFEMLECVA